MKKLIALATLVTGLGFNSFAQEIPKKDRGLSKAGEKRERVYKTPEELAKIRTERLDKELKFNDAQREQVYKLNLEQAKKQKDHQSKVVQERQIQREEREMYRQKFEGILTPDQQSMLKEKYSKLNNKRDRGRGFDKQTFDRKRSISKERETPHAEHKSK